MNKYSKSGFTLIELMIVVAIIGILAAVAIPAYQNYTTRAQISEAMELASKFKTEIVGVVYSNTGTFNGINSGSYGLPAAVATQGNYVSQVEIKDGVIEVTVGKDASKVISGEVISFTPINNGGSVSWKCTFSGPSQYVPESCR